MNDYESVGSDDATQDTMQDVRLILRRFDSPVPRGATSDSAFADDVRRGLTATAKHLPPKYFYDELGSQLFEAICLTPEYYVTRAEDEIFATHADDIISRAAKAVVRQAMCRFRSSSWAAAARRRRGASSKPYFAARARFIIVRLIFPKLRWSVLLICCFNLTRRCASRLTPQITRPRSAP
jgi:hypothetical protein